MWWGPGIHSSLQMSNNTFGFRYFSLGTFGEKEIGSFKVDLRYIFSKLDNKNIGEPYFSALLGSLTFSKNPVFTVGFSRSYVSPSNYREKTGQIKAGGGKSSMRVFSNNFD